MEEKEIKRIVLKVGEKAEASFTVDEAKSLFEVLKSLFKTKITSHDGNWYHTPFIIDCLDHIVTDEVCKVEVSWRIE